MRIPFSAIVVALLSVAVCAPVRAQSTSPQNPDASQQQTVQPEKKGRSAKGDIGSGTGDIGKGAAKGTGSAAKGAGKGAADLVTLHPLNAAGQVGKGGAVAGKDVAVGTTKGTGKVVRGWGRASRGWGRASSTYFRRQCQHGCRSAG